MTNGTVFVHEDVVIVALPIKLLNDLLGQEGKLVAIWAFIVTLLQQFFLAPFIEECATFIVSLKLLYFFRYVVASSILEGAIEGKMQSWNKLYFKDGRASIRTWSFLILGPRYAFEAE